MKPIVATLILYNMPLAESPTYRTLMLELSRNPGLQESLELLVFDNSARAQVPSPGFPGAYVHDGANRGLACRYDAALAHAVACGAAWLLLLDQDTVLTPGFFIELLALIEELGPRHEIVAVVPKLTLDGALMSPHVPMFRPVTFAVSTATAGIAQDLIRVYNSGATIRISALTAIGGFPGEYWLDYLDHAVFHRLQSAGGKIYLMRSALKHDMAMLRPDSHAGGENAVRHRNQLAAELRFYAEHGSPAERRLHRTELFKQCIHEILAGHFAKATRLLTAAFTPGSTR